MNFIIHCTILVLKFSIPLQGKNEAIELKTVNSLVLLLKDDDVNVKCKSALALETYV